MTPYRTSQQEREQTSLRLRGIAVAAQSIREWNESSGTDVLVAIIQKNSGGDDALFIQASVMLATCAAQQSHAGGCPFPS